MLFRFVSILAVLLQSTQPAKTGSFEQTFTERSPQTEMKSIVKKLAIKDPGADYRINEQTYMTFVPEKYSPDKPMGLVILINYKNTDTLPTPVLPQFEDANCTLLVGKDAKVPMWYHVGQSIDVVYNMRRLYSIDPRRVYIFNTCHDSSGQIAGLHYPEIFTGVMDEKIHLWHTLKLPKWAPIPGDLPTPDAKSLTLAKTHPFVDMDNETGEIPPEFVKAFRQDGFKYLLVQKVTIEQMHYPMYTTDWIPVVFKFLDGVTSTLKLPAEKDPATKPAHRPATKPSK